MMGESRRPRYDAILFDLDGTLTDPGVGIINSIRYGLDRLSLPIPDQETLRRFIGPPLYQGFMDYCGLDEETALRAIEAYRAYFSVTGLYENTLYEGIPELLRELKAHGRLLALATSKPEIFARRIVDHFGLADCFDLMVGSELDGRRTAKAEVVKAALEDLGREPGMRAVMVGDREHDVIGAKANGIEAIGVTYGYGSREELAAAGAARIVETVEELGRILLEI